MPNLCAFSGCTMTTPGVSPKGGGRRAAQGLNVFVFQGRSSLGLLKLSATQCSHLDLSIRNMLCLVTRPAGWSTLFIDLGHSLSRPNWPKVARSTRRNLNVICVICAVAFTPLLRLLPRLEAAQDCIRSYERRQCGIPLCSTVLDLNLHKLKLAYLQLFPIACPTPQHLFPPQLTLNFESFRFQSARTMGQTGNPLSAL